MAERLRSEDPRQHFGAYYELVVYQFFKAVGYEVQFHPSLESQSPDLKVEAGTAGLPVVVEVATVFDDPLWEKEERKLKRVLRALGTIEHYFHLHISVDAVPIPEAFDSSALATYAKNWLDGFDPEITSQSHETEYDQGRFKATLTLIPRETRERGPVLGGWSLPARWLDSKQMRRAIYEKARKYKVLKQGGWPFVIAASVAHSPLDDAGIVDVLFGSEVVRVGRTTPDVEKVSWSRKYDGLFTGAAEQGRTPRHTHVSALLEVSTSWLPRKGRDSQARHGHSFRVLHNPFAHTPLTNDLLAGYPQFVPDEEEDGSRTMKWIDGEGGPVFDC
jgi:hypothetical protein